MKSKYLFGVIALLLIGVLGTSAIMAQDAPYNCIFIPKSLGNPWFISMQRGFDDYTANTGGIQFITQGADTSDPAAQVQILEDAIAQQPDCILIVPNDTAAIEPAMQRGMEAGIMMLTQEASSIENAVADIEFLQLEREGQDMFDLVVRNMGTSGEYAIMVGGLTTEGHMARADAIVAYQEANFPGWHQVTDRLEGSENAATAHDTTLALIQAYPDLDAIVYIGSQGGVGGAQAVRESNLIGHLAIVGAVVPSQSKQYLADGSLAANYIGNPYRIGLDSAYIAQQLLDGANLADLTNLPSYGAAVVTDKIITFHADTEVNPFNVDTFGF